MLLNAGELKKRYPTLILFLMFLLVFTKRVEVSHAMYNPGETLNPSCLPSNSDCTVMPPVVASVGTTLTNQTISGDANTILNIGNSSLVNDGLTITAGSGLNGGGYVSLGETTTMALNLGASNVWTGLQTFNNVTMNNGLNITVTSNQLNLGVSGSKTTINANTQIADRIMTIPALTDNDAFVFNNNNAALTNKTIAAGNNTITGLTTNNLSAGASIANTQLANPNINIITASGSGLQGGGVVGLGGSLSLSFISVATPGTYGSASQIPVIQIDQYGSVVAVTPTTISGLTTSNLSGSAGITNSQLVNSSIFIDTTAGTGIGISGSPVALGGTIKIDGIDATNTVKGMASFDATNFLVVNGAVDTIQNIDTLATPTFNSLFLSNNLSVLGTTDQLSLGATNTTTISATAPSASRIATIPGLTINDTFAFVGQTQTFINKTIAASSNTITGLTNSNLSGTAGITDTNLATITTANKVSGSAVQLNTNGGIGDSGGLTLLRTCSDGQLLKWTAAGGWACDADVSSGTPSVYLDGGLLSDGTGLSLIRTCSDGQLLKWTAAGGWACNADNSGGGGSLTIEESDQTPSVSSIVELQFGSTLSSSDEFIVSDVGSSTARIRIGNKVVMIDTAQTLTNKTISAVGNTISGLTNSNLSGSAGITDANLATITTADKVSGSAIQLSPTGGLTNNSGLSLITTCSNSQVLAWNSSTSTWGCGARISILSNITAAIAANTINSSDFAQIWNWSLITDSKTAFTFGEDTAAINGTGSQYILGVSTKAGSTAGPLKIMAQNNMIIDTTALGGITIGSQAANQPINILSGTGAINIGTDPNAKTITIGAITGATAINMTTGTGGFSLNGMGSSNYSIGTSTTTGTFTIGGITQTGTANLFTSDGGMTINLGTGNASNVIAIGNSTTSTSIELRSGTGSITAKTGSGNGMQFLSNTVTDDSIKIAPGQNGGAATFQGTITTSDLTATRTWTLQNASGQIPLSTLNNGLFFTTTGNTTLTLPTSGTVTALGNSTTGSGSALVLSTSPTFTTSIVTPLVIGSAIADGAVIISGNSALSGNNTSGVNIKFNVGDSGATTAMTILNNGYVGVGTTAPVGPFELISQDDFMYITKYSNDVFSPGLVNRKARGTINSPLAVQTDDKLASLGGRGYDGISFPAGVLASTGAFQVVAGENFTSTNHGTYLSFIVTPIGSTTRSERMRLDPSGGLNIFNTTNQLSFGSTNTTTISSIAPSASRIATIPGLTIDDTFVFVGQTQTLTNKTFSLPTFTGLTVGTGTTGVFIDSSGNLSTRTFGAMAFASSAVGGGTNGLSMIGSTTVGLGGTLVQNTSIGTSSFSISFLGLGNSQALFVGSSGFVGIGTTNPQAKMNVIGNLQMGNRIGSSTPSYLLLDSGTSEPGGSNGAMYYNNTINKFRCYENGAWRNCTGSNTTGVGVTFGTVELQTGSTLLGTVTITPATAAGDIYIYGDLFTNSLSNTDQTITAEIRSGTTCGGTLLAEGVATLTGGNGTNGPSVLAATLVQNPGATAQNYALCGKTTTAGGASARGIIQALVIDTGADLAEIYTTNDETIEMGDVVSLDSDLKTGMKKSQTAYDQSVLGVVSAKPGLLIGDVDSEGIKALPVALSGRVLVKVNNQGGPIKAGDPLTTSSTPGVAMRASKTGAIIGTAMSDFNSKETGQILVFIKNGSNNGKVTDLLPGVDEDISDYSEQILAELMWQKNNLVVTDLSEILTDRLVAGVEVITPRILTNKVETESLCVGVSGDQTCITKTQLDQILLNLITPTPTPP